jgi:AraC-like DNA-binding protein
MVDMRGATRVFAGTFPFAGNDVVTDWHCHDLHQLEYAFRGTVQVETTAGRYLLPPQQAVWIPAGLTHRTTIDRDVETVSVFFHPLLVPDGGVRARVLAAAPVIREMILYGVRWPINRPDSDAVADRFFAALADLVTDWLDRELPLWLPTSTDPVVASAMDYTNEHLALVTARDVSRAVGMSERNLRRHFRAEVGISWRDFLLQSRLLRAMTLLAEPGPSVLRVATDVGFDSVSAFTRAFRRRLGETPTAYRRHLGAPS